MEQFVLVPASVYNKNLKTQAVTEQELPKYEAEQNRTYQIDSLRKEISKKLFAKADFSRENFVFSYQSLNFADFNIGWCGNWSFTVRLCPTW